MTRLRQQPTPAAVRGSWALSAATGAATLLLITTTASGQTPAGDAAAPASPTATSAATGSSATPSLVSTDSPAIGLLPSTLASALRAVVPPGSRDPRVSGAYGSGHRGSWQFTAYLTWIDQTGTVAGGRVDLPAAGDSPPLDLRLDNERVRSEHQIGLTLTQLDGQARRADAAARLAMLELSIEDPGAASFTTCSINAGSATGGAGSCTSSDDPNSTKASTFPSVLTDRPEAGPLAVTHS